VAAAILLVTWAIAGLVNDFIMGGPPTTVGVAATLVAVCAWIVTGWLAGSRSTGGFVRSATAFWALVVVGAPAVFWMLTVAPGREFSEGGWINVLLLLLLFVLMAPLYGLYALLPAWEPIAQSAFVGITIFAMTLAAYYAGRRISGVDGSEVPSNQAT
jgi:hypothetical protein